MHSALANRISDLPRYKIFGKVISVRGLAIECVGFNRFAIMGSRCRIYCVDDTTIEAEIIGFRDETSILMAYDSAINISPGCVVEILSNVNQISPDISWKGRVINAFCEPLDEKGPLTNGIESYPLNAPPPSAFKRRMVSRKLDLGVRAVNTFITCCVGQRLGVFAGSGVGKSMLMSMFTKFAAADIKIIGLIGERGKEVQEFINDYLGPQGMENAIIVVSTSDESALMKKRAAQAVMSISEYFRNQGLEVLTMIDSVTRFAMALREIGLSQGEPPTSKGYTPSVFAELPKLLERAGPGCENQGNITAIFNVLVEGDDNNEPIADAVRSIIDGHIVLDRAIADKGRYPAIDILKSVSRSLPKCNQEPENKLIMIAKEYYSAYVEMADMIRIGAYKAGSDPKIDMAIKYYPHIEEFLKQRDNERDDLPSGYNKLATIVNFKNEQTPSN